ncbi:questin oxidase family protein [Inhella sp.]|uniref:questin oxidase family protein n=1 Tax=Inhella sp. TaxID=1921806 RepID=UPI0035B03CAB
MSLNAQHPLHALLSAGRAAWHPLYQGRLVSHLPMAQHALWALGASSERLQAFSEAQVRELEPLVLPWPAPALLPDWRALRGRAEALPLLVAHFDAELDRQPAETLLQATLPELLDGGASMAFHLLIRTAHAWQSGHSGELALALGLWASQHAPLWRQPLPTPDLALDDWLAAIRALPAPAAPPAGLIDERMQAWAATPGFAQVAARLQLQAPADGLRQLAEWLARAYAASGNFTLLHGVTGSRALRVLLPYVTRPKEVVRRFAIDAAAALLASRWTGEPAAPESESAESTDWPLYFEAAGAQDDEHVIKLVHACAEWALPAPAAGRLPMPPQQPSPWAQAARRALQAQLSPA